MFAQVTETSGSIVAQWGAPGAIILIQFGAIVWLARQLLVSNATIVAVLKEGQASKEAGDEKDRTAVGKLTEAIHELTRAHMTGGQADRDAIRANTEALSKVSASVDALAAEQRTTMRELIARRPTSVQSMPAVGR